MDEADNRAGVWRFVCTQKGRMIKFILEDQVEVSWEAEVEVVQ
jgi:hypothetical protein